MHLLEARPVSQGGSGRGTMVVAGGRWRLDSPETGWSRVRLENTKNTVHKNGCDEILGSENSQVVAGSLKMEKKGVKS